jgi:colanic acid biosynthesis protein WcaH|tara:strand:- start:137 stop:592 length:456 start_codon:yes stop_codon:yes gene_type:complete
MICEMIPTEEYREILEKLAIPCVDVFVENDSGEVLMIKRDNEPAKGQWWLPGGRIFKRETIKDAAIRKIREEVGLELSDVAIVGAYETIFDEGPFGIETGTHSVNVLVKGSVKSFDTMKTNGDHSGAKFFKDIQEDWHSYLREGIADARKK